MSLENPKDPEESTEAVKNTQYLIVNKSTVHNPPPHFVDLSRKLLCIEYPGIVDNVDRMVETLGGMHTIEMQLTVTDCEACNVRTWVVMLLHPRVQSQPTVGNYNRRLELRFRSNDIFSKPCWGDKDFSPRILVKITVRQPKTNTQRPSSSKTIEPDLDRLTTYHYQVIGITTMTFKFTRLCDFQYLPLIPTKKRENSSAECRNIYESIIPRSLPDFKWFQSNESCSMPLFFPPPIFAKFNTSKENKLYYERYKYYERVIPEVAERLKKDSQKKKQELKNVIDRSRLSRRANSVFINFHLKDVTIPTGPTEQAIIAIKKRGLERSSMEKIVQLFKERPIWSKSALLHRSGVRSDRLKIILPGVAYHFPNGPWRVMWCKFGFDPRLDPSCHIYQTFDFRVRSSDGLKVKVQAKRSYSSNLMHYRAGPATTDKFSLKDCSAQQKYKPKPPVDESYYILKPNMLPPARQMFYQYCDLHLPEIQDMLNRLPEVSTEATCHPKNGWLPNGFSDHCREIVNKYVTTEVKKLLKEDKEKKDETQFTLSAQRTKDTTALGMPSSPLESFVPMLEDPIVIDSDDSDGEEKNLAMDCDDVRAEDEVDGNEEMTDSDDENERGNEENDDDDIDLEAVDEINEIIGNLKESETPTLSSEEKEDSEEEFDPELVRLYHKLIVSNTDTMKNV